MMTLDKEKEFKDGVVLSAPGQLLDCKLAYVETSNKIEATVEESKNGSSIHGMVHYLKQNQFETLKTTLDKDAQIKKG